MPCGVTVPGSVEEARFGRARSELGLVRFAELATGGRRPGVVGAGEWSLSIEPGAGREAGSFFQRCLKSGVPNLQRCGLGFARIYSDGPAARPQQCFLSHPPTPLGLVDKFGVHSRLGIQQAAAAFEAELWRAHKLKIRIQKAAMILFLPTHPLHLYKHISRVLSTAA